MFYVWHNVFIVSGQRRRHGRRSVAPQSQASRLVQVHILQLPHIPTILSIGGQPTHHIRLPGTGGSGWSTGVQHPHFWVIPLLT